MAGFDDLFNQIKGKVVDLAKLTLSKYKDDAIRDTNQFLEDSKADLKQWAEQLAAGTLSPKDVEWLMKGRMDLAQMALLKTAGLSAIRLDSFKNSLFSVVVDSILGAI